MQGKAELRLTLVIFSLLIKALKKCLTNFSKHKGLIQSKHSYYLVPSVSQLLDLYYNYLMQGIIMQHSLKFVDLPSILIQTNPYFN